MALVLLTAIFNGCTQRYDQSMMNNLNLVEQYTGCQSSHDKAHIRISPPPFTRY